MKTQVLIEALDLTEAVLDTDTRTVRQRLIAAGDSLNKRRYSEKVLQEASALFEGVKTYANHPSKADLRDRPERDVRTITGWISGIEYKDGALYGTRHFTETQAGHDVWAMVKQVVEGNAPTSLVGGSINAIGKGRKDDKTGVLIVEAIHAVNSVDDVTTPAAGGGFEPLIASVDTLTQDLLNTLDYEEWFECRPDYRKRLQNEMKVIRQDEAVKAAQADADKLTETIQQLETSLKRTQKRILSLQTERDAALADSQRKTLEVEAEKALAKVQLPSEWKTDLRNRLLECKPEQWLDIMAVEIEKAKRANVLPQVPVMGAGQRTAPTVQKQPSYHEAIKPRDGEDAESWGRRVRQLNEVR